MPRVLCFGEVLWDCLPWGRCLGGAPLNVAFHLRKLGIESYIVSAVGADDLGDEAVASMRNKGLPTLFVERSKTRPTGTVQVELDGAGQPRFEILSDVAWDDIPVTDEILELAAASDAVVFGTLAARSGRNRAALRRLLEIPGPRRVLDVNLRTPFDDLPRTEALCHHADLVKLNRAELARLSGLAEAASAVPPEFDLQDAILRLAKRVGSRSYCVTLGEDGACYFGKEGRFTVPAPRVTVQDTVGAGDAFTAALVAGQIRDSSPAGTEAALKNACALGALIASLPGAQPAYDAAPFLAAPKLGRASPM